MIEKKEYTRENSTAKDREALRGLVYLLEDDIIYYKEAPLMSEYQIDVVWGRIQEIVDPDKKYYIILDLVGAKPPKAKLRGPLKDWMNKVAPNFLMASVFTEKNKLINLVAKFVLSGSGFPKFLIHKTKEEAMATIREDQNLNG